MEDFERAKLRIIRGVGKGREFSIESTPIFIGRGEEVSIQKNHEGLRLDLPDHSRSISRKHAKIVFQGGQYQIIDTSVNGTVLNGKKVSFGDLKNNSTIEVGISGGEVLLEFILIRKVKEIVPPRPSLETKPKRINSSQENPFLEYTKVIHHFHQGESSGPESSSSSNLKWFAIISIGILFLLFLIILIF